MKLLISKCTELLQQELLAVHKDSKLYVPIRHTVHQSPEGEPKAIGKLQHHFDQS